MPLIPIQVQPPRQEKDTLDKLVQGFALAQSILGTGLAIPKFIQERKLAKGELAKTEAGTGLLKEQSRLLTPEEQRPFLEAKVPIVPKTVADIKSAMQFLQTPQQKVAEQRAEATLKFAESAEERARRGEQRTIAKENKPKELSQATITQLEEGRNIPNQLDGIETLLSGIKDISGPLVGRTGQINPYDKRAQVADAKLRATSQAFGRYMENGVLRKEDEEKYRKMFPQLSDTPDVQIGKLNVVRDMLKTKQESLVGTFKQQGFDMSGFEGKGNIPGDVDEDGVISEAEKWVMDNPRDKRVPDMIEEIKRRRNK